MKQKYLFAVLLLIVAGLQSMKAQEAYAVYTSGNTTLTFYYDNQRTSRTGATYDLNTGNNDPGWTSVSNQVTKVVFDASFADARPTSTSYWFFVMESLKEIEGINYLNTDEVTTMRSMFATCESLTSIDVSNFNTSKVTNMNSMFYRCKALRSLDLSNFNTANVTEMNSMFVYCSGITSLDLSSFNTAKVTNMHNLFQFCQSLKTIYVSNGWSTASVTDSDKMFYNCTSLVGGQGTTYDENHTDLSYAHIDGGPSNPGYFTAVNFDLTIAGIQVTGENMNGLTELVAELDVEAMERYFEGEMEITFDGINTLTLKNAIIRPAKGIIGILSQMPDLNIRLIGENTIVADESYGIEMRETDYEEYNTTFLGSGSLNITSNSYPFRTYSNIILKDGARVTSESTSSTAPGLMGRQVHRKYPTLTLQGKGTLLKVKGGSEGSLTYFKELNLSDGITIMEPVGATFVEISGVKKDNIKVANEWVVIGKRGDVNLDGTVDIADAVCVLNAMAGQSVAGHANVNGDYDDMGKPVVDIADLVTVLNIMAGQ